jgi:serine protease Do
VPDGENPPTAAAPAAPAEPPRAEGGRPSFAALVSQVEPAVVHLKVTSVVKTAAPEGLPDWFGEDGPFRGLPLPGRPPRGEFKQQGAGSGFIIRGDGVVLTNHHVVNGAKEITVVLSDGREFPGRVLGRDAKTDLAVVKIDGHGLPVARLGDSDTVRVGDWVVAIGNPFGLSNTVTAGIVSAKGRTIAGPYDDFIQTDAPINPGNSGGPLFDEHGNVVGINSAIFTQGGGNIGIGFAIPINMAKKLVPELEQHGHVTRGWLGVSIQKLTPELAESLGVDAARGVLVASVMPNAPAATAGLQPGDVILRYDGKPLDAHTALPPLVAATPIGTTVPVEIMRDGKTKTLEVTVTKLAEPVEIGVAAEHKGRLGLRLRELTPSERERRELGADEGVLVAEVVPDSPAAEAGIEPGDVVLRVNRTPVDSVDALKAAVEKTPEGKAVLLLMRPREGADRFVTLAAR